MTVCKREDGLSYIQQTRVVRELSISVVKIAFMYCLDLPPCSAFQKLALLTINSV